jgi:hypothetical protein
LAAAVVKFDEALLGAVLGLAKVHTLGEEVLTVLTTRRLRRDFPHAVVDVQDDQTRQKDS